MCDIVFEKAKGRGGTVNRRSVYAEAEFAEFTREHLNRNLFSGVFS